jgi:mono/diheme cytochrome c family protein
LPAASNLLQVTTQTQVAPVPSTQTPVERGEYLVTVGGCNDCHSPKVFTNAGPEPDQSRILSGHLANEKLPAIPSALIAPDKWGAMLNNNFTAFVGPWGVSFAQNLTPDKDTGLGSWTEEIFIKAIRTGKHQGEGRPILPPMPWPGFKEMTDDDLKAVFAYLRTLPPNKNPVPEPIPPGGAK